MLAGFTVWLSKISFPCFILLWCRFLQGKERFYNVFLKGLKTEIIFVYQIQALNGVRLCWENCWKSYLADFYSFKSVNPFLFIRGLSCHRSVQTTLTQSFLTANYTWISLQPPSCILWSHWLLKSLEILPQSVFTAIRALLPFDKLFCWVIWWWWKTAADSNGLLALFLNFKGVKQPFLSAAGCHTWPSKF